jgi:hypothetical protein
VYLWGVTEATKTYADLIRAIESRAREITGGRVKLAESLGFSTHRSLASSLEPGGLALDTLLKIVEVAQASAKDRDDLIYAHIRWKLSRTPEGKVALAVIDKSEHQVPADAVANFRAWVVRHFLDDFMGTGLAPSTSQRPNRA